MKAAWLLVAGLCALLLTGCGVASSAEGVPGSSAEDNDVSTVEGEAQGLSRAEDANSAEGELSESSAGDIQDPVGDEALNLPQTESQPALLTDALPGVTALAGWKPVGDAQIFDAGNLYDLVDGQADAFFAYAFEQVVVGDYETARGEALRVAIWQVATPADAYGLYTTYRAGTPVPIGNEGDADPGRRLDFWQDRYFVRLFARQLLPEADLLAFAEVVAAGLPGGGTRPALIDQLPPRGLVERSAIFFHREISIQNQLWLGGENRLGLSPETDAALARYDVGGETGQLLLVQYPDAAKALAALEALETGQIDSLVTAQTRQNLLGAVFGQINEANAGELLAAAQKIE